MTARDYKPLLRAIFEAFERLKTDAGMAQKALMVAFGVDAAQYGNWRKALDAPGPWHPNQETRDAIEDLLNPDRDPQLQGMEVAVHEMRGTVNDLEAALEVRRALRVALATPAPSDKGHLVESVSETMRVVAKRKRVARRKRKGE